MSKFIDDALDRTIRNEGKPAEATTEPLNETIRRFARYLSAVKELHAKRRRDGDGFTIQVCRECGWNWPCPTIRATEEQ